MNRVLLAGKREEGRPIFSLRWTFGEEEGEQGSALFDKTGLRALTRRLREGGEKGREEVRLLLHTKGTGEKGGKKEKKRKSPGLFLEDPRKRTRLY